MRTAVTSLDPCDTRPRLGQTKIAGRHQAPGGMERTTSRRGYVHRICQGHSHPYSLEARHARTPANVHTTPGSQSFCPRTPVLAFNSAFSFVNLYRRFSSILRWLDHVSAKPIIDCTITAPFGFSRTRIGLLYQQIAFSRALTDLFLRAWHRIVPKSDFISGTSIPLCRYNQRNHPLQCSSIATGQKTLILQKHRSFSGVLIERGGFEPPQQTFVHAS